MSCRDKAQLAPGAAPTRPHPQTPGRLTVHLEGLHGVLDGGNHPLQRRAQRQLPKPWAPQPPSPSHSNRPAPHPNRSAPPSRAPLPYLLDQPHLELREEQLGEEAEQHA